MTPKAPSEPLRSALNRRALLKSLAVAGVGLALPRAAFGTAPQDTRPAPKDKLKILILGGTGFLGPKIVESATARGHVVTLFNRGKTRPELFPDLEKLRGDRDQNDYASLKDRSFDAVVDTAPYSPREVKDTAAALGDRVKHYVCISSISVYPDADTADTNEDSAVARIPGDVEAVLKSYDVAKRMAPSPERRRMMGEVMQHYGALKALCEEAAEAAYPKRTTNIRPGLIVGDGDDTDRFAYWPLRIADGGEVLAPIGPDQTIQWIDVKDLGAWIVRVMEDRTFGVFNAVGPAVKLGDLFAESKKVAKSDPTITYVSREFLEAEQVAPWTDLPAWVPPPAGKDRCPVSSGARAAFLGLQFSPIAKTVEDTLAFHRRTRATSTRPFRGGLPREREKELLLKWKEKAAAPK
jgi:2'-hydroxyisoflavone reductase